MVVVGAGTVIAKLATTTKEVAVASWFGRNDSIDAFLLAMVLPLALTGLIASSFNGALVPVYIRVRENEGEEAAQRLLSSVQALNLFLLVPVLILLAISAPYYLPLLGSGFSLAKLALTTKLLYLLLPGMLVNGVIAIWSSALNADERFALPALTPATTPLVSLLALFFLGRRWGIFALAGGAMVGPALEAFLLGRALRVRGISLKLRWFGLTPEVRVVIRQYIPIFAGTLVLSVSPIIDQSMAAMLKPGSVAALSYGYKVVSGIVALTTLALSTAVLPYFAQMVANKQWAACRRTLKVYSRLILLATIPLTAALIIGSRPLLRGLFQRGAFTAADTTIVNATQISFALIIPFAAWSTLFVRLLSSLQRSGVLVYCAVLSAVLNVAFNIIFMRILGVAGIALSTSLVCAIVCALLAFSALKLLGQQESAGALKNPNRGK